MTRVPQSTRQIINTIEQLQVLQLTLRKKLRPASAAESLKVRKISLDVAQLITQLDQLAGKASVSTGASVEEVKRKLSVESEKRRTGQLRAIEPCDDTVRKADGPDLSGVMVALYPPMDLSRQLAVPGGEAPERLHITVIYFEQSAAERDDWGRAIEIVRQVAVNTAPFDGDIAGTGRFVHETGEVAYAEVSLPGLIEFHESLVEALEAQGFPVSHKHLFKPHVTLKYTLPDEPFPDTPARVDSAPLKIGEVRVVQGGRVGAVLPLGRVG